MENINLIRKIAWSFHTTTGMDFDDLFQEAAVAYLQALETYDPSKGKITTHMWWNINSHLKNYLKREKKYYDEVCSIDDLQSSAHPITTIIPFWETLSKDAQEVANTILSSPKPFIKNGKPQARKRVKQIMTKRGWDPTRIWNCLYELKSVYS